MITRDEERVKAIEDEGPGSNIDFIGLSGGRTAMQKILVTEPLHEAGLKVLEREFTVEVRMGLSSDAILGVIGEYDAVITRSGTAVKAETIEAGVRDGGRLRVVGRAGIGVDNIDIKAATARG